MSAADRYPNLASLAQCPEKSVNPAIGEQCRDALAEIERLREATHGLALEVVSAIVGAHVRKMFEPAPAGAEDETEMLREFVDHVAEFERLRADVVELREWQADARLVLGSHDVQKEWPASVTSLLQRIKPAETSS